jgi:flagellar hook-length control protein FliK
VAPAGKEIAAAAVPDRAGKEVVAAVMGERTGKDILGLVKDANSTDVSESVKAAVGKPVETVDQSMQNQGQTAGQSDGSETGSRGFEFENADVQVDKTVEANPLEFEITEGPGPLNTVESVSGVHSVSASQASARVSGVEVDVTAAKPIDQIIQQLNVVDSTVSSQRIQMTLTPDDLGTVRITFRQVEGEMVGMVEVQKDQTRREVEEAMPQLVSAMQQNGLSVRKVEVLQWNNSDQQAGKDSSSEGFNLAQEREFAQQSQRDSSGSSAFGRGQSAQRDGVIPLKDTPYADQQQVQKGLDFLV